MKNNKTFDKFAEVAAKIGSQIHLMAIRDAFMIVMPVFILAGITTLVNNVVFPFIASGDTLANLKVWGDLVGNGTLNISGLLIAPLIAYQLSQYKHSENPFFSVVLSLVALVIIMPMNNMVKPVGADDAVLISGVLTYANLGTRAMFAGIFVGIITVEVFERLSKIKSLKINLGESVPEQVSRSFSSLIPAMITISLFGAVAALLHVFMDTNLVDLIRFIIQEPIRNVAANLPGFLFIRGLGDLMFTFGIHQAVITNSTLSPLLLINMNENMQAFNAVATEIPHILTSSFIYIFPNMGGSGSTISLLIAIFIASKSTANRSIAKMSIVPGLFGINEPVIFGLPIVFNVALMIPFVLVPMLNSIIGYFATYLGLISKTVVLIPWITPPVLSGYLATAGDIRTSILQILLIILGVIIYLPFLKLSEKIEATSV